MAESAEVDEDTLAIQESVRDALREHALLGRSVSIWRDGRIVELTPPEILQELREQEASNGRVDEQ